jgi:hypothetical protein
VRKKEVTTTLTTALNLRMPHSRICSAVPPPAILAL